MKIEDPCGSCDIGVYSELACLNKKAREFRAMNKKDRCKNMPMCKHENHICWGAKHYHEMITEIDSLTQVGDKQTQDELSKEAIES